MADLTITPGVGTLVLAGQAPVFSVSGAFSYIPTILNIEQLQHQLNAILAVIYGAFPGFGTSLPSVNGQIEGRVFVVTPGNTSYQLQDGVWVAI